MSSPSPDPRPTTVTARAGFGAVVLAAAVSGLALLIAPESTGTYFSWGLGPPPLASLVGGLYLASAVTFGMALRLPWVQVRSLLAASVALTTPTLAFTLVHLDIFDMGRWQAWAWLALFAAAPPFWAGLLWAGRGTRSDVPRSYGVVTLAMMVMAVLLAVWAIVLWIDPPTAWRPVPFDISGLGGRFVGAWLGFLAVMAAWTGLRPRGTAAPCGGPGHLPGRCAGRRTPQLRPLHLTCGRDRLPGCDGSAHRCLRLGGHPGGTEQVGH